MPLRGTPVRPSRARCAGRVTEGPSESAVRTVAVQAQWRAENDGHSLRAGSFLARVVCESDGWRWYVEPSGGFACRTSGARRYRTPEAAKLAAERSLRRMISDAWRALMVAS